MEKNPIMTDNKNNDQFNDFTLKYGITSSD